MLRSPSAPADGARDRLRALRTPGWGGREDVDVGPAAPPRAEERADRVGWPGAPPGTPAARLRLAPPVAAAVPEPEPVDDWWDDDDDDPPPVRRGSAWDPPERDER